MEYRTANDFLTAFELLFKSFKPIRSYDRIAIDKSEVFPMSISNSQIPGGWYVFTGGPPTSEFNSPEIASAWSRNIHEGMRNRDARASKRFFGSTSARVRFRPSSSVKFDNRMADD